MTRLWDGCRTLVRALAVGGLLGLPAGAAAQVTIEWQAPPPCPTRDAVAAHVARLLAGSTAARTAQPVSARAIVRELGAGYLLELVTDVGGEHGERTLQAPSCAELAAASAVIVALLVDPAVVSAPPPSSAPPSAPLDGSPGEAARSEPSPRDDDAPEPDEVDARDDDDEEAERDEPAEGNDEPAEPDAPASRLSANHVLLRPELVLDAGTMPRLAAGPGLALGVRLGAVAIEGSGSYAPLQRIERDGRSVAELEHAAAALAVCYALPPLPAVSPCARVQYGRLWGQGLSVRAPEPGGGALAAAELSLRAVLALGQRLALSAEFGLALPLLAPLFTVDGVGVIHEPATVLARLRAGLEVRL